jgi:hypothetical protein
MSLRGAAAAVQVKHWLNLLGRRLPLFTWHSARYDEVLVAQKIMQAAMASWSYIVVELY